MLKSEYLSTPQTFRWYAADSMTLSASDVHCNFDINESNTGLTSYLSPNKFLIDNAEERIIKPESSSWRSVFISGS